MSDTHTYHWLVIHDKASITTLSLAIMKESLERTGKPGTDTGRIIEIEPPGGLIRPKGPTPLRITNVSSGNTKVAIADRQFADIESAIEWSKSPDGISFLREHHDAFLIAVPKAK